MMMTQPPRNNEKLTIGVLYGFRALMVFFVCNYHFWQQSWIAQQITIFGITFYFDFFTRSGYLFVDGMLFLSGFLLYLPYAQATETGVPAPDLKTFYRKRFRRIVPSYLASVFLTLVLVALPGQMYMTVGDGMFDVFTHLTFTFTFFKSTYLYTPLNGVLWTIGIEVQFYLVFPLLVKAIRKKPVLTLSVTVAIGFLFRIILGFTVDDLGMFVNQMPSFLDVYALGILGAILYIRLRQWSAQPKANTILSVLSVPVFVIAVLMLLQLLRYQSTASLDGIDSLHLSQWVVRFPLALTMMLLTLSAAFLPKVLQKPLDNRLMRFLATISMNLYIWHQVLCVQLIKPLFPDTLHTDTLLQTAFTLLCYSLSILVSMAFTYGLEQPAAVFIQKLREQKRRKLS